jgi:LuxR family maltose regulon positive regulatory protein
MAGSNASSSEAPLKTPLIRTKLSPPKSRATLVERAEINRKLDEILRQPPFFVLVSAPPGYGKTISIVDWLNRSSVPFAWLTLDRADNDPARFIVYLITALQRVSKNLGRAAKSILAAPQLDSPELLMSSLIEDISRISKPFCLVLDDSHTIRSSLIHKVVQFLLDNQPPSLNLMVLTREDPPLSFARIRAQNLMVELRVSELRFTREETSSFFRSTMEIEIEDEIIEVLDRRVEGWAAGLQLIALSIQSHGVESTKAILENFGGSSRYVIDYFIEEVLKHQSESERDFLLKTGILDRFCPELCDSLTGRGDAQKILREMEEGNYFLVSLDDERKWFRYHSLFADVLRMQIDKSETPELYKKAVRWFEGNDLIAEAVKYAILSRDGRETVRLISKGSRWALLNGRYVTLLGWISSLPEDEVRRNTELSVYRAWSLFLTGQIDLAADSLSELENILLNRKEDKNKGRFMSLKAWIRYSHGEQMDPELARGAFQLLGEGDSFFSVFTMMAVGYVLYGEGSTSESQKLFRKTYYRSKQLGNLPIAACALHNAASVLLQQGRRREAEALCLQEMNLLVETFGDLTPVASIICIPMAEICYLANDLKRAEELALEAAESCRQFDLNYLLLETGERILAMTKLAVGNVEEALSVIYDYRKGPKRHQTYTTGCKMDALEADIATGQGNVELAERWARSRCLSFSQEPGPWSVQEHISFVRLLLAQHRTKEAEALLVRLADEIERIERFGRLIEVRILQAITLREQGRAEEALEILERAVLLADKEDCLRPFLDEGQHLSKLLARLRHISPRFIDEILDGYRLRSESSLGKIRQSGRGDLEALSRREREVLKCISEGLSNTEISDKLFISLGTVKWHINNIFSKLDVRSRTQATVRARDLGLI